MASPPAASFRYFISPGVNGGPGDGTAAHPRATVREAVAEIAARHGGSTPSVARLKGYDQIDICSIAKPNVRPQMSKAPRYQFYVDPLGTSDASGAGTAHFPWPDLESALSGVAQLDQQG